ncbi:2-oxo acid dehydrogenase subunit E2 [Nitratiruptor sp. YY09-18]|uniref:2-oxo acid dehydrogenase subunit E2 n=1 Tax=Nitratiruptor sp. YY09-18 TaxID=2724901 RepID=UPI0019155463|nr:2-oxo acid dehydrogenase subunit E2 [Nitratiruptor sp. YY09-18]BCD68144.1 pyruvate dehydrogenase E2 component [Nitratiruptor sp. YY09-18]
MEYKITMPVLSDTMEKGKLIKWHVNEGQQVKKGDVIAEVESDKAIMEVQTFKDGVVKKLLVKEGDEVPVKSPIAIIETATAQAHAQQTPSQPKEESHPQSSTSSQTLPPELAAILPTKTKELKTQEQKETKASAVVKAVKGAASPAARVEAQKLGIDIEKLQAEQKLPKPAHLKDIKLEALKRYFTPKALELLQEYALDPSVFAHDHKIDADEVQAYIKSHNIPKTIPLSTNRLAVKSNVETAAKKPIYHVYETFTLNPPEDVKITAYLLKVIGDTMQNHPLTRAVLEDESYKIYPASNISVAVAKGDALYMVVCKNIESKNLKEIDTWVKEIKQRDYSPDDLQGSTFGLSNLGMFGIRAFDAMINKKDSGIAAFGKVDKNRVEAVFTFDHRILNGVDAAKFVSELKNNFAKGIDV